MPYPAEKTFHRMHQVRVPAPLFSAPFVQQQVQSPDLLTHHNSQSHGWDNHKKQDQKCRDQSRFIPAADARLDAHVDRMEDDRDHDCQEDGTEKRPGDEITEVKCNRGQSHQEEGGCYLFPFHWYALSLPTTF